MPLKIVEVPEPTKDDQLFFEQLEDGEVFRWSNDVEDYVYMKVSHLIHGSGSVNLHTGFAAFGLPLWREVERLDAVLEFTAAK